ncbi:MAG: GAF domain-containing sensor histidine kinase [Nitrospirota bacterium]|nr:GAF domain-containing sensor histidine kinase [Nitrospirota bacterium]
MLSDKKLLDVLISITDISNNGKLAFREKLGRILHEIAKCIDAEHVSVMLLKNSKNLEVVASTNPEIIGATKPLDVESPSTWVLKNRTQLYVDRSTRDNCPLFLYKRYMGDAFFLVPIIQNERAIGVMNVREKSGGEKFNLKEQELLITLVGHVIIALENNRLAETLQKKQRILKKRNLELKKLEGLKTDLYNMLVHDLKGPISEIAANLDILSYVLEGEHLDSVATAQSGCDTLYNMIANLLDISRLEDSKIPLVREKFSAMELMKEAHARLLVSVKSKKLTFVEQYPETGPAMLEGDRNLLVRVLQNLMTNAIQFTPQGEKITMGYSCPSPSEISFFIEDSGPGIPEEYRETVFDKYSQLNKKNDGRVYTTGLGLAFCKMAVRAHGGDIWVEDGTMKGSRLVFTLPLKRRKGK